MIETGDILTYRVDAKLVALAGGRAKRDGVGDVAGQAGRVARASSRAPPAPIPTRSGPQMDVVRDKAWYGMAEGTDLVVGWRERVPIGPEMQPGENSVTLGVRP